MIKKNLPKELRHLVGRSVKLLGLAIKEEYGLPFFQKVERLRKSMKNLRGFSANQWSESTKILKKELKKIEGLSVEEQKAMAKSFSAMLELINRCESAYRTFRLGQHEPIKFKKKPDAIIFVLTAHPTEARGPEFLTLFKNIQDLLVYALLYEEKAVEKSLFYQFKILLKIPLARHKKPTVLDEAENIYNFALKEDILSLMIKLHQEGHTIRFRTWVGGDKDGHPGIDEKTMETSLNLSRKHLIEDFKRRIAKIQRDLALLENTKQVAFLKANLKTITGAIKKVEKIATADGKLVLQIRKLFLTLKINFQKNLGFIPPVIEDIISLLEIFPALVLSLEFREDSELVNRATKKPRDYAIGRMLLKLERISQGLPPKWYVRGLIMSMVESKDDIKNGHLLLKKTKMGNKLPVVPLFETEFALKNSVKILQGAFDLEKSIVNFHKENWKQRFEVMLGYSDSSKENGVFPSRLLIFKTMRQIDLFLRKKELIPVFFHGNGGSVERGGGSIKEQTAGWPKSARKIFKATIQGEMVARSFASNNIFLGNVEKITHELQMSNSARYDNLKVLDIFSQKVKAKYQQLINDQNFLKIVEQASPYAYLDQLKIGSRPAKRKATLHVEGLRAIPWILCWTQTRVLLPTWWGVGSSYFELSNKEKMELKKAFKTNTLFGPYMKVLGFTLAKVDLSIWQLYLENSPLDKESINEHRKKLMEEFKRVLIFFKEVTGEKEFIWSQPWLFESIYLRSSMVHPLNLLQLVALKENNSFLLRQTVTGVACGMLTTG
jgi:phosphoenolpyruvate carboxylase